MFTLEHKVKNVRFGKKIECSCVMLIMDMVLDIMHATVCREVNFFMKIVNQRD